MTYKLITKYIVNRLKQVLPDLTSPMQSSFVLRLKISDNIILMQEFLHSMRKKTGAKGSMAIKVYLEKAYDGLRWGFIQVTLTSMRFLVNMTLVIMNCISTCSLNILWTGNWLKHFNPFEEYSKKTPFRCTYLWLIWSDYLISLRKKVEWGV